MSMLNNIMSYYRYYERTPRPANPINRPAYQGSNPVADIFSLWALRQTVKYLPRIAKDRTDAEARQQMLCVYISLILLQYPLLRYYGMHDIGSLSSVWQLLLLVLVSAMQVFTCAME